MRRDKSGFILYGRLLGYVKPYAGIFALSIFGMVLMSATEVALPVAVKPFLDGTFIDKDPLLIKWTPIFLVLLFLVRGMGGFIGQYAAAWVGNKVVADLRIQMMGRLLNLPIGYFQDIPSGNIISRFTYDVAQVTQAATQVVTVLIKDSLTVIGLMSYLLYLNWKLTLITFIMIPPIALVVRFFNLKLRTTSGETQIAMGNLTQVVQEVIECIKVVKIFAGHKHEKKKFFQTIENIRKWMMRQTAAAAGNVPVVQLLAAVATAIVVHYVTLEAQQDMTTVGGFVSFLAAMLMLTAPLKRLTGISEHLQRGIAAADTVFLLIDSYPERDQAKNTLETVEGNIEFSQVDFKYPVSQNFAVNSLNFEIKKGETVAIVGSSGGGKTTVANLLARFYEPQRGQISIDGIDISSLKLENLRRHIALVSQEVALFNDTVAANIAYGGASTEVRQKIIHAAEGAFAKNFILEMPDGFDTIIGEKGVRLSGGQRQRLAIARAFFKNAPILILDEATSALDSESEKFVQAALSSLMRGRTSLVIAHRLSTIEKASRIIVLEQGKLLEVGTHDQLMKLNGRYSDLYNTQFHERQSI
ncbi:MAG: lipid A export permease/ATP-binding protein MsbA [Proteobacteria bacterium]|nr:lipid A export permease/ATP-binding protein MsbA [Pseudomonadota bacterium]